jgi:DNA-binding response OmpR family regulator
MRRDVRRRKVLYEDREASLTPLEWEVLDLLWESKEPVSVEHIGHRLYQGKGHVVKVRSVIARLKRSLARIDADCVKNVYAHGYILDLDRC